MKVAYSYKTDHKSVENSAALADKTTKNGKIFILTEGSTNDAKSQFVAKLAVHSILEFVDKKIFSNVYLGLNEAIQYANSQVYRKIILDENLKGVNVSVAIFLIKDEGVYTASLGKIYGYVKTENKLVKLFKESSNIQLQGYKDQTSTTNMVKALGILPFVYPNISNAPVCAKSGDVFILATENLVKSIGEVQLNNKVFYTDIDVNASEIVESSKRNGVEGNYTIQLITVIEGVLNETVPSNIGNKQQQKIPQQSDKEVAKKVSSLNFNIFGKKINWKVILLAVGVLIFLFAMLRSPKDDSDMKFEDQDSAAMVNDTTNQYQDLDDIMEYEAPVEEEEEEEEEEESDSTSVEIPEELRETPAVADGDEGGVEQKVESEVEQETKAKEPKPKTSKSSVYVVKSGDNLGRISEKFHVKMEVIKKANNLSGDGLRVGQELIIP